jgi:glycosyltransferase involved in cell wall biosynthesis
MRRRVGQVFVVGETPGKIAGYYSLSAASFEKDELRSALAKRLWHYPVPAAVLGRLAIDRAQRWFSASGPPVVLSVGRLARQKDFPTLLRAFVRVRERRPLRLAIGGKASPMQVARVYELADELGIRADVTVLGLASCPIPCPTWRGRRPSCCRPATRASRTSWPRPWRREPRWPAPTVRAGRAGFLDNGAYGPLVEVGDDAALAEAITRTLDDPPAADRLRARGAAFDYYNAIAGLPGGAARRPARVRCSST